MENHIVPIQNEIEVVENFINQTPKPQNPKTPYSRNIIHYNLYQQTKCSPEVRMIVFHSR